MTQPGEIDGVMKQMTQSFNPVIQETMRNPTVLKWLALSLSVTFTSMIPREVSHPRSEIIIFSKFILRGKNIVLKYSISVIFSSCLSCNRTGEVFSYPAIQTMFMFAEVHLALPFG